MTEEQKAKKRERNRLWAQKKALEKKQESLSNEQFQNLTPEEIQARKRDDQARMQDLHRIAQVTPNPLSKEQQVQAVQQILDANPELEQQFKDASMKQPENAPEQHTEPPHLTIDYLVSVEMQRYARAKGNIPKLLEAILTELVTIRVSSC